MKRHISSDPDPVTTALLAARLRSPVPQYQQLGEPHPLGESQIATVLRVFDKFPPLTPGQSQPVIVLLLAAWQDHLGLCPG